MEATSRRGFLVAIAAAVVGSVARVVPAAANDGDNLVIGRANTGGPTSLLDGGDQPTFSVRYGNVASPNAVDMARSGRGIDVKGFDQSLRADGSVLIDGALEAGGDARLHGQLRVTKDVIFEGQLTVWDPVTVSAPVSTTGTDTIAAVTAAGSVNGVGVVASGRYPLRITPGASRPPGYARKGDLFVDKAGRLWFCKGGERWKQLA